VKVLLGGGLGSVHERDLLDQRSRISGIGKLGFGVVSIQNEDGEGSQTSIQGIEQTKRGR
jgi:hypothetical protein